MRAAMASQLPRVARVRDMPWNPSAAPGGGSEHADRLELSPRPDNAFCFQAVVRWVECDEFGHLSQSQYALLTEEARAVAAAAGAFGNGEVAIITSSSPTRFDMDFVGQAKAGDRLQIYTWWDGDSICSEIEKLSENCVKGELLTKSRVWFADQSQTSRM
eukprot:TRINITY_DN23119_c0_g1_i1.p1 TRINITY_DN23119_c0_g1~~TRINITY_DN23119_c0_g1_i1.p1  ORF type:complete len:160 (+),score=27.71 TRINITY_DN23119_c0_g1_i1:289-768(+)